MSKKCILCQFTDDDSLKYGELLERNGRVVHTYCLYLSSNLPQSGTDEEDFLGFLLSDIKKEQQRVKSLVCCFCGLGSANIGCCAKRCRRVFHLICGIKNGAENKFVDSYQSFCNLHVTKERYRPDKEELCCICYDRLRQEEEQFSHVMMIRAPCCSNGWFHKYCLQHFANTSGYFFKCPLCNDTATFRYRMRHSGIFIPQRDAAWELEPHAFEELTERPSTCAAIVCLNKRGRSHSNSSNLIVLCMSCGSVAMHQRCLPEDCEEFACNDCKKTVGDVNAVVTGNHEKDNAALVILEAEADKDDGLGTKRKCGTSDDTGSLLPSKKNMPKNSSMADSSDDEDIVHRTTQDPQPMASSSRPTPNHHLLLSCL